MPRGAPQVCGLRRGSVVVELNLLPDPAGRGPAVRPPSCLHRGPEICSSCASAGIRGQHNSVPCVQFTVTALAQ